MKKQYTVAETFVGAGGSHIGFIKNNFKTLYINDFCNNCIQTIKYNFSNLNPECLIECKNIQEIDGKKLLKKIPNLDVLFGGIVCKGFSLAGEKRPIDERNYLYLEQLRLVSILKPKISVIENVPTFFNARILKKEFIALYKDEINTIWKTISQLKHQKANKRKKNLPLDGEDEKLLQFKKKQKEILKKMEKENVMISVFDDLKVRYENLNYRLYHHIINSAWYGSATCRDRLIIVAVRKDIKKKYEFPQITHFDFNNPMGKKNLPIIDNPQPYKTVLDAFDLIDYQDQEDKDNIPMKHNLKTIKRFSYVPEGGNMKDINSSLPQELQLSVFHSRGCNRRLTRLKPSFTLVPGHSAFPIHPIENRSITVREAASIMGFPIKYKFFGSHTNRCEQVGNAVPIELSTALALSIKNFLDKIYE